MQIKDYTTVKETANDDLFLIDGGGGTRTINSVDAANDFSKKVDAANARKSLKLENSYAYTNNDAINGPYNILVQDHDNNYGRTSLYTMMQLGVDEIGGDAYHKQILRFKNLGSAVTDEQWEEIRNGKFRNLFVGDYWHIGNQNWRIVDNGYWYNTGDVPCRTNHLVIMPDYPVLKNIRLNNSDDISGGYLNTEFRKTTIEDVKSIVFGVFGENHVLKHREVLTNSYDSSTEIYGNIWTDSTIELPTTFMLTGNRPFMSKKWPLDLNDNKFILFNYTPWVVKNIRQYWTKDIGYFLNRDGAGFIYVASPGVYSVMHPSKTDNSIRPVFGICAENK